MVYLNLNMIDYKTLKYPFNEVYYIYNIEDVLKVESFILTAYRTRPKEFDKPKITYEKVV